MIGAGFFSNFLILLTSTATVRYTVHKPKIQTKRNFNNETP